MEDEAGPSREETESHEALPQRTSSSEGGAAAAATPADNTTVETANAAIVSDDDDEKEEKGQLIESNNSDKPVASGSAAAAVIVASESDVASTVDENKSSKEGAAYNASSYNRGTIVQIPPLVPPPPVPKINNSRNDNEDEDDVTSKAAVALAAVAAAAVANHKSPAEAAREARAVAQSFISTATSSETEAIISPKPGVSSVSSPNESSAIVRKPIVVQTVKLSLVKSQMRQRALENVSSITDKLCKGENDAFLQLLLLLEHYRCIDDTLEGEDHPNQQGGDSQQSRSIMDDDEEDDDDDEDDPRTEAEKIAAAKAADEKDLSLAKDACDKVISLLKKIESAYESMVNMLPRDVVRRNNEFSEGDDYDDVLDYETPVIVPDLLPPCTSQHGDATVGFFRACLSEPSPEEKQSSAGEGTEEESLASMDTGQVSDSLDAPSTGALSLPKPQASAAAAASAATPTTSMFSSMFRRTPVAASTPPVAPAANNAAPKGFLGTLRQKTRRTSTGKNDDGTAGDASESFHSSTHNTNSNTRPGEYVVKIEREMLGLTVENVLERTVVRTVLAGGPAKKAGAKVGSLIVKVGNVETKNLTHFETIDELRQSQRPLQLVLRQISDDALRSAREEMGRLIRGSGFGEIMNGGNNRPAGASDEHGAGSNNNSNSNNNEDGSGEVSRPLIAADLRIDAYSNFMRRRFSEITPQPRNKKEEALARIAEKLVWMLTFFVVGLEREASRLSALAYSSGDLNNVSASPKRSSHGLYHHTTKDYADAAKSVAKVLLDFTAKKLDPHMSGAGKSRAAGFIQHSLELTGGGAARRGRKAPPPPPPPPRPGRGGRGGRRQPMVPGMSPNKNESSMIHEKPLLQIGDVLQRTRTFLADTTSPPAALLRSELIAFLCDVLDIDSDMELSEDEAVAATAGGQHAGPINDLGSAGSLLKLIILNCPIMRSPNCEDLVKGTNHMDPEIQEELRRRFGPKESFSSINLHKLHAGNRFLAVVHRLAASRSTSARITACSLGPVIWGHLDFPHQLQLRGVITRALHDVDVLVRKSTAAVLHEIAELVFDPRCVPWLVLMCERAMTDPEPQLRSAAMTLTWHLAEHLPNAFLGDASQGSRYLRRLPSRNDPIFADVYLLQCKLLPVATRLAEDRAPSVRLAVAAQCDRLCDALGDHWSSVIIDVLLALLSDSDERVRCEAVMCVPRLANIVLLSTKPGETAVSEVSILEALVPASIKLQKDTNASVRVSLAAAAGELLLLLVALQNRFDESVAFTSGNLDQHSERSIDADGGRRYKRQVDERLIPLLQKLLNDSDPEVTSAGLRAVTNASRRSITGANRVRHLSAASEDDASLSSFHSHASREARQPVLQPVLSEVQVLRLLPTLTELADSRQWRVRQSAVEIVPALLGCTQKLETRSEISKLCVRLMGDTVDAVRKTAAECLCMGGSSLGSHGEDAIAEWITSIVIPTVRKCATDQTSKQRLLSLKMIEVILSNGACPPKWNGNENDPDRMSDTPTRELAAIALSLTNDRIANVRLNVGRVLESVIHVFEEEDLSFIREVLLQQIQSEQEREGGGDRDVLYFATKCVNAAKQILDDRAIQLPSPMSSPMPFKATTSLDYGDNFPEAPASS